MTLPWVARPDMKPWINAPSILFHSLLLATTLTREGGFTAEGLRSLPRDLEAVAHCGYRPEAQVTIEAAGAPYAWLLYFELGLSGMYLRVLRLCTRVGEISAELIDETINPKGLDRSVLPVAEQTEEQPAHSGHQLPQGGSRPVVA